MNVASVAPALLASAVGIGIGYALHLAMNKKNGMTVDSQIQQKLASAKEKIQFLQDILETNFDAERMHQHYKEPVPGQIYYGGDTSDGRSYIAVWARDLKILPSGILGAGQPKLTE